jgi:hypothetical protein
LSPTGKGKTNAVGDNNSVVARHKCTGVREQKSSKKFVNGLVFLPDPSDTGSTSKQHERETMDKRIAALEEALIIWSNVWGNSVTEWGMKRAEVQIAKINRQLAELTR